MSVTELPKPKNIQDFIETFKELNNQMVLLIGRQNEDPTPYPFSGRVTYSSEDEGNVYVESTHRTRPRYFFNWKMFEERNIEIYLLR